MSRVLIAGIIGLALGIGGAIYFVPSKVKIVEVTKTVEVKVVDKDIHREITKTIGKDGKPIEKIVEDETSRERSKSETASSKVTEKSRLDKDWILSGYATLDKDSRRGVGVAINRRIIGGIYLGAFGASQGVAGVGLTILF